jgi:hypothetical protein
VVGEAVEDGGSEHLVAEDVATFGVALAQADDHGAAFVAAGRELKHHLGSGSV